MNAEEHDASGMAPIHSSPILTNSRCKNCGDCLIFCNVARRVSLLSLFLLLWLEVPVTARAQLQISWTNNLLTVAGARVVVALPDRSAQAWILMGPLLSAFESAGGAAGPLGYPVGDPTATGRQLFENGALAGTPVQVVSGGILVRWALLN